MVRRSGKPQLIGHSRFYDHDTGLEVANSWEIRQQGEVVEVGIGTVAHSSKLPPLQTDQPVVKRFLGRMRDRMIAEERATRRMFEVHPVPKPRPSRKSRQSKTPHRAVCPDCDGVGELMIDNRLTPCPRCDGDKWITIP